MPELGILDLLQLRGFDARAPAKLVRHKDDRYDIEDLLRRGWFDAYQGYQQRPVFKGRQWIVSFVGTEGSRARLVGVYRVAGQRNGRDVPLPPGCPFTQWQENPFFYDLVRESGYEDLENRLVIEWGGGSSTRSWHQNLRNKPVVELLPKGRISEPFRDYLEFTLSHDELVRLYESPSANMEWQARLSAVAGVYLVLDTATGNQYVGSAHGATGIWGRWREYASNGHGNNRRLEALIAENPIDYPRAFSYSILQILPRTSAHDVVLEWERRYKKKLGSRATGLNAN